MQQDASFQQFAQRVNTLAVDVNNLGGFHDFHDESTKFVNELLTLVTRYNITSWSAFVDEIKRTPN